MHPISLFAIWYSICVLIHVKHIVDYIHQHEETCFQDSLYIESLRLSYPQLYRIIIFVCVLITGFLWPVYAVRDVKDLIDERRNA